ncbi:MAG: hypothetical protein AAF403_07800 [Pseudomonadota bacterium]
MNIERIAVLRNVRRVWIIGAIMGEYSKLRHIHEKIEHCFEFGDKIIYTGNYFGPEGDGLGVIKELLEFRCWALASGPFMHCDDVVFLSGRFEQMWLRANNLHRIPDCGFVMSWMLANGFGGIVRSYGLDPHHAQEKANQGPNELAVWLKDFKSAIAHAPGHKDFIGALKWMALTSERNILVVSSGLAPHLPLTAQAQFLWWTQAGFDSLKEPYRSFKLVVRGYDKYADDKTNMMIDSCKLSLDSGSGRGGRLSAVCLDYQGHMQHQFSL